MCTLQLHPVRVKIANISGVVNKSTKKEIHFHRNIIISALNYLCNMFLSTDKNGKEWIVRPIFK